MKACRKCEEVKPLEAFARNRSRRDGRQSWCKVCSRAYHATAYASNPDDQVARQRQRRADFPKHAMLIAARQRAKLQGLPFDLDVDDFEIPDKCPVFNIPLQSNPGRARDNSPSLDKLVPSLGYVRGNVQVISNRANRAKSDLTLEEVEALAAWLSRYIAPAPTPRRKANHA